MIIDRLQLEHYRNYKQLDLSLTKRTNVIVGNNAQGKTNVLEAIAMLAFAKSHRTNRDRDLVRWDDPFSRIHGTITRQERKVELELRIQERGKKVLVNGIERRKVSEFIGIFNVVLFAPEHLDIVKRGPNERRKFLDMELGQINPTYLHHLMQYTKILAQRNKLLKTMNTQGALVMLSVWDEQLAEHGAEIIKRRFEFVSKLQQFAEKIHCQIAQNESLTLDYMCSLGASANEREDTDRLTELLLAKLAEAHVLDIARGTTTVGPHRDDLGIAINDRPAAVFASQGQQRTAALSIKLAEIDLIVAYTDQHPVLLLDDVLSELDERRQIHLIEAMDNRVQTIITTASTFGIDLFLSSETTMHYVQSGVITTKRRD